MPNCAASKDFASIAQHFAIGSDHLFRHLDNLGHAPTWIDLSVPNAPRTLTGATLHSVRVIVPGLLPIAFGTAYMPLGMNVYGHPGSRFPHPFM